MGHSTVTGIVEVLKDIGSFESAAGAITAALVSAIIAFIGWVLLKIWAGIENWSTNLRNRREAITHLFVDALNCRHVLKNSFSEQERLRYLGLIKNAKKGFRAYIVTYEERDVSKEISPYVASLPNKEIAIVSMYLESRGLFNKYYRKTASKEFALLPNCRKENVLKNLFNHARELEIISDELVTIMKYKCGRGYLKEIDKTYDEIMKSIDKIRHN